jgi:hypothetical protein
VNDACLRVPRFETPTDPVRSYKPPSSTLQIIPSPFFSFTNLLYLLELFFYTAFVACPLLSFLHTSTVMPGQPFISSELDNVWINRLAEYETRLPIAARRIVQDRTHPPNAPIAAPSNQFLDQNLNDAPPSYGIIGDHRQCTVPPGPASSPVAQASPIFSPYLPRLILFR